MPTTRPKTRTPDPWEGYLVLNADSVVLGVYGSAIRDMAVAQADKLRASFPMCSIRVVTRTLTIRPRVGDTVA